MVPKIQMFDEKKIETMRLEYQIENKKQKKKKKITYESLC